MPFLGNIGPGELIIILIIALVVFGPGKLPEVGQALGKGIREFRRAASDVTDATRVDTSPAPQPTPPAATATATPQATAAPATIAAPAPPVPPAVASAAPASAPTESEGAGTNAGQPAA